MPFIYFLFLFIMFHANIKVNLFFQYLNIVRRMDGYAAIVFPHCPCDSHRDGHVIAMIGLRCFKLQACKEDGTPEVNNLSCIICFLLFTVVVVELVFYKCVRTYHCLNPMRYSLLLNVPRFV